MMYKPNRNIFLDCNWYKVLCVDRKMYSRTLITSVISANLVNSNINDPFLHIYDFNFFVRLKEKREALDKSREASNILLRSTLIDVFRQTQQIQT